MDADSSEAPDDLREDLSSRTHVFAPTSAQRSKGHIAAFVHKAEDGWTASGTITKTFRGLSISQLTVDPPTLSESVSAQMLRKIPLGEILNAAASSLFVLQAVEALLESQQQAPADEDEHSTAGRTPLSEDLLRRVALGYVAETAPGKKRGAVKRLAGQLNADPKTVSRWVWRARQNGWLGPAAQGREGGGPGPKLLEAVPGRFTPQMAGRMAAMSLEEIAEYMREAPIAESEDYRTRGASETIRPFGDPPAE